MQLDAKALADATALIVKQHIIAATQPLIERIQALEARPIVERGEKGEKGDRGEQGEPGRDGVGNAGALIDRSGVLVLTLTDGTTRDLGVVVGKDGVDGKDGEQGPPGVDGKDGDDGLGWDEMDEHLDDDGRTVVRTYRRGDQVKEFRHKFAVVLDRGVFKVGETYDKGDSVTWGGSTWIAQVETAAKPDSADSGWRLAVKKGRDGKDAK